MYFSFTLMSTFLIWQKKRASQHLFCFEKKVKRKGLEPLRYAFDLMPLQYGETEDHQGCLVLIWMLITSPKANNIPQKTNTP